MPFELFVLALVCLGALFTANLVLFILNLRDLGTIPGFFWFRRVQIRPSPQPRPSTFFSPSSTICITCPSICLNIPTAM
ncbi:hypothetical protein PRIPAC_73898 [Pristionchus pacificus]|uniref:Uncharacterized protein n=1 Tax=Pristionchus pacificus TaxID=54126 RepID=A0A2A6CG55_PRIPA|nr:hypothetical protein PRIPAC_73898 [Pristionchus pacificus]|eukprot:PDM77068.1 hypothetical protein PRIPAC_42463 [Pristionchus pacificus]